MYNSVYNSRLWENCLALVGVLGGLLIWTDRYYLWGKAVYDS